VIVEMRDSGGKRETVCGQCPLVIRRFTRRGLLIALGQHILESHPTNPGSDFDGH
jgi:hypothetical protein